MVVVPNGKKIQVKNKASIISGALHSVYSVFQPIIDLKSEKIFGYEALTRGKGKLKRPDELFRFFYQHGEVTYLDLKCLNNSLNAMKKVANDRYLFVNVEPATLGECFKRGNPIEKLLKKISPARRKQIVFELTEGMKARDFSFIKRGVNFIKSFNCKFAIDDVSGIGVKLFKLTSLKPDFLKIDISLISGLSKKKWHQKIVRKLIEIAGESNALIVAEGLETIQDVHAVKSMGIHFAQGFYYARPAKTPLKSL